VIRGIGRGVDLAQIIDGEAAGTQDRDPFPASRDREPPFGAAKTASMLIGSCALIRTPGAPQVDRICRCVRLGRLVARVGAMIFAVVARSIYQTLLARCPLDMGGMPYGDCQSG
jgi:hypothetical protein